MAETYIDFRHVKEQASFAAVLDHYGDEWEGKGAQRAILCPFHQERKASCKIDIERNLFKCFGCSAKGNVLDFVAKREAVDLRAAALLLADWCHIDAAPPRDTRQRPKADIPAKAKKSPAERRNGTRGSSPLSKGQTACAEANAGAREGRGRLRPLTFTLTLDPAHPYLGERGLTDAQVERFGLGFASRGVMAGRIAIPIHDETGQLVAYAGRWPGEAPDGEAKYLFPPAFPKSQVLFNLNRAIGARHMVVVEGFFGAFALDSEGVPVVAVMGSSISPEQLDLLEAAGVQEITVLMDGDAAGIEASKKVAGEAAERFFVRRTTLPHGMSPDDALIAARQSGHPPDWLGRLPRFPAAQ